MSRWRERGAVEVAEEVASGRATASSMVEEALAEIERGFALGAFLSVDAESARQRARILDQALARGEGAGPLAGVPVALKANLCLAGSETSCGSRILAGYRAPYTATAVERLLAAGAIPVGMTNMDEFAMGSSSENSAFGPTRNPWDPTRTPGGSSSGSAVAVAAGMVPLALGSDTGGSVRQPAALCGVVGFKPTYGRVSRYGLVAFGSSLDQISPFARRVEDVELALGVLAGADGHDSTCFDGPAPGFERLDSLAGIRVGVIDVDEAAEGGLERPVRERFEAAVAELGRLGASLEPVSLPTARHALEIYYVVATAEASSNLARYDGVRYGRRVEGDGSLDGMIAATRGAGLGTEVQRRILLGTYALSAGYAEAWYQRALRARRKLADEYAAAFARLDVIVSPTTPGPAFPLGARSRDPLAMYMSDVLTVPANLAGLPAVSVPCGFVDGDAGPLPVGLQITGPQLGDARVLAVARVFETGTDHRRLPAEVRA